MTRIDVLKKCLSSSKRQAMIATFPRHCVGLGAFGDGVGDGDGHEDGDGGIPFQNSFLHSKTHNSYIHRG